MSVITASIGARRLSGIRVALDHDVAFLPDLLRELLVLRELETR